jgi:hypothetical protein
MARIGGLARGGWQGRSAGGKGRQPPIIRIRELRRPREENVAGRAGFSHHQCLTKVKDKFLRDHDGP